MIQSFDQWIEPFRAMGVQPGLDTIKQLLALLDNPQDKIKVIHIAGTNGKGTSAVLWHNILWRAGYKTGLFMSPYLTDPEEMCVINNQCVSKGVWLELAGQVNDKIDLMRAEGQKLPTEYEIYAAMMYLYFYNEGIDFAVVEVAMGGLNDCTNVCKKPVLTLLTAVGLDHQKFLGDTHLAIAKEKSGIMKKGVPLILHPQVQGVEAMIKKKAKTMAIDVVSFHCDLELTLDDFMMSFVYEGVTYRSPLLGRHQKQNILGVLEGVKVLEASQLITLEDGLLQEVIESTSLACRFERHHRWIFDGAHNKDSLLALKTTLQGLGLKNLVGVLGVLGDKDLLEGLQALRPYFDQMILIEADNARKCPNPVLKERLETLGYEAISLACHASEIEDLIKDKGAYRLAFGSFYMVGPLRTYIKNKEAL